jgi:hypothetical protein
VDFDDLASLTSELHSTTGDVSNVVATEEDLDRLLAYD